MELEKVITSIQTIISNDYFKKNEVYLFGSFLKRNNFADIDILIIYCDYIELKILKGKINNKLNNCLLHFTCLTQLEEKELDFIRITNAMKIENTQQQFGRQSGR